LEVPGSVEKGKELGEEGKQHEKKRKMKKATHMQFTVFKCFPFGNKNHTCIPGSLNCLDRFIVEPKACQKRLLNITDFCFAF